MKTISSIKQSIFIVLITSLVGCGGGGGEPSDSTAETTNTAPVVKTGNFDVSLVEGMSYESGNEVGTTDNNGKFSYEEGKQITFKVGDIVIGVLPARARVSIFNLVSGAKDETNETVINIMRFLLTIDNDNNLSNGIQITTGIANQAIGVTINFAQKTTDFSVDGNVATIVQNMTSVSTASTRTLAARQQATDALTKNIFTAYSGIYDGTYSGDDSGTWSITLDENGVISGNSNSNAGGIFSIVGKLSTDGNTSFTQSGTIRSRTGNTIVAATFSGAVDLNGKFTGTWQDTSLNESGSFSGNKQVSDSGNTNTGNGDGSVTEQFKNAMSTYDTVTTNFSSYQSNAVVIKAPAIAENGAVVPVTVETPNQTGTLWIFVDSNPSKPAARIDYISANDKVEISSLRVKMAATGNIIAIFDNGSGTLIANSVNVKVTISGDALDCPSTPCVVNDLTSKSVRMRTSSGVLKMLATSPMYIGNYVSKIKLTTDTTVKANAYFTPYISQNPYLSLVYPVNTINVSVEVTQLNGSLLSSTIPAQ